jgi:hypothetical protein
MDSRYFIEKLYNMTVNQSYSAAQKELSVKEMEAKLNEVLHLEITITLTLSLSHWELLFDGHLKNNFIQNDSLSLDN